MMKSPRLKGVVKRILIWQWVRQNVYFKRLEEVDSYFYCKARGGSDG
jgi:hypothetical protein